MVIKEKREEEMVENKGEKVLFYFPYFSAHWIADPTRKTKDEDGGAGRVRFVCLTYVQEREGKMRLGLSGKKRN